MSFHFLALVWWFVVCFLSLCEHLLSNKFLPALVLLRVSSSQGVCGFLIFWHHFFVKVLYVWCLSFPEFQCHRSAATVFTRCRLRGLTWKPRTFSVRTSTQATDWSNRCAEKTQSFTASMWKTDTCEMLVTCSITNKGISVSLKEEPSSKYTLESLVKKINK